MNDHGSQRYKLGQICRNVPMLINGLTMNNYGYALSLDFCDLSF